MEVTKANPQEVEMKKRPDAFLASDKIAHDSEIFDYISELHTYLWKFVRIAIPGASGRLSNYVDEAIVMLERKNNDPS